jgi:hypothetical protein
MQTTRVAQGPSGDNDSEPASIWPSLDRGARQFAVVNIPSKRNRKEREDQGHAEALRYLGTPDWLMRFLLIKFIPKVRTVGSGVQLVHRFAGRPRRQA